MLTRLKQLLGRANSEDKRSGRDKPSVAGFVFPRELYAWDESDQLLVDYALLSARIQELLSILETDRSDDAHKVLIIIDEEVDVGKHFLKERPHAVKMSVKKIFEIFPSLESLPIQSFRCEV